MLKWKIQIEKKISAYHKQKMPGLTFINKKCHDMIYSDCEFSSELFSNLLICDQPPKQLETWDSSPA